MIYKVDSQFVQNKLQGDCTVWAKSSFFIIGFMDVL